MAVLERIRDGRKHSPRLWRERERLAMSVASFDDDGPTAFSIDIVQDVPNVLCHSIESDRQGTSAAIQGLQADAQ